MRYYFYVLKNDKEILYKGITNNLERRVRQHNSDLSAGTRGQGPWKIIYHETFLSRATARGREKYFKSGTGREKLKRLMIKLGTMGR